MTPAEHYAHAERLLTEAETLTTDPRATVATVTALAAIAQAHATLATMPKDWCRQDPGTVRGRAEHDPTRGPLDHLRPWP